MSTGLHLVGRVASLAATMALLGGCQTAPIPNPSGLSSDALTLEYVLDRGCFAYMLREQTEWNAMGDIGLHHQGPPPALFDPPGPPMWRGLYAGLSNVVAGTDSCSVNMKGHTEAYRAVTQKVLQRRFGPAVEQDAQAGYRQWLPGQVTGCHNGLRYTYYENRRGTIFSVDINRVDCQTDRRG